MYSRWFSFLLFPLSDTCQMLLQFLELWNPICQSSITQSYSAHAGIISSLTDSPSKGTIASASHDRWIKIWRWRFFVDARYNSHSFFIPLSKLHQYLNDHRCIWDQGQYSWHITKCNELFKRLYQSTNFRLLFQTPVLYFIIWKLTFSYIHES